MAKSLSNRFNGTKEEIISFCRKYGRYATMEHFSIKDCIAFSHFLENETHDHSFGLRPDYPSNDNQDLVERLVDKIHSLKSKIEEQDREIAFLRQHKENGCQRAQEMLRRALE